MGDKNEWKMDMDIHVLKPFHFTRIENMSLIISFTNFSDLYGDFSSKYIGEITDIVTSWSDEDDVEDPFFVLKDTTGESHYLKVEMSEPKKDSWKEGNDFMNEDGHFFGLSLCPQYWGEHKFFLPFSLPKSEDIIRLILNPEENICWNFQCDKNRKSITSSRKETVHCQICKVVVYCSGRCLSIDATRGGHSYICKTGKLSALSKSLKKVFSNVKASTLQQYTTNVVP
ncbi:USP36_42 [Lepeophtheirus salmonis]|uniref:USP36_42 n=1 Tax=Lepeophtheirus salmonis TaxID=72036 RepID=A0A7R8H3D4_LEPSM|nr:USP36_42 [Lepeophtheirus salmonis]CAF2840769.1 USP36_42 [Lepeophtheirus salmonis]